MQQIYRIYFFLNVNHPEVFTYIYKLHSINQTQEILLLFIEGVGCIQTAAPQRLTLLL